MESRQEEKTKVPPSFTALNVAQAFYRSASEYNHPLTEPQKLIRYLVTFARHHYPVKSRWYADGVERMPTNIGNSLGKLVGSYHYNGHVETRKLYIENKVEAAINSGATQVLVIGGGFDVLATMKHKNHTNVQFFEIDRGPHRDIKQNALLALKNGDHQYNDVKIAAAGLQSYGVLNDNIHFIDADMSQTDWLKKLENAGFDRNKETICIAEGFTMYVPEKAIQQWLNTLSQILSPKSSLILSFLRQRTTGLKEKFLQHILKKTNEGYLTVVSQENAPTFVFEQGFTIDERLPYDVMHAYLGETPGQIQENKLAEDYYMISPHKNNPDQALQQLANIPIVDIASIRNEPVKQSYNNTRV